MSVNKDYDFLVVEDDTTSYLLLEALLSKPNINLSHAVNGAIAIDMCKKYEYDLIFMDIRLPEVNGIEATKEIKKISPATPILVVTAYAQKNEIDRCFDAGCDDYISKPIDIQQLYQKIEELVNKKVMAEKKMRK